MDWKKHFYFGETLSRFDVPVLNERELRGGAGIMFLFAMIAFMNAFLLGEFFYLKLVILAFLIDFTIRVWVNPKYAPTLIIARIIVGSQKPEYVGAPQKRFAWMIGFVMAVIMFGLVVVGGVTGPVNFVLCLLCLIFLFCESVFGICIGCKIYPLVTGKETQLCGGGVCDANLKEDIQKISHAQKITVVIFVILMGLAASWLMARPVPQSAPEDCNVPDWAKAMGHEEQYKLHHGCEVS